MHRTLQATLAFLATLAASGAFALDPQREITVWTIESGLPHNTIDAMVQTGDGYLWLGTEEGLVRFDGARFVVSNRQNTPALRSAFISSLFEARDGTLWIGTHGGGIARLREGRIEAFQPGLLGFDRVRELYETADGALFAATAGGGLLRIEGEEVTRFTAKQGVPERVWALENDGAGGLWVATHGGGVIRWRGSRAQERITLANGLPSEFARALLRDPDGTLWIGTDGGVAAWRNGSIVRVLTTDYGLPSNSVRALLRDDEGALWIGTDRGLARWRGFRAETLGVEEGFPSIVVRTLLEDREGSLWAGASGGLVRLSAASGRRKIVPPQAHIEEVLIDGTRAAITKRGVRVPPGTPRLDLQYTAADLRHAKTLTFRYLLEGHDRAWVDAGTNRVARYTNLAPGQYTFRVTATNAEGVRSRNEARLVINVAPRWFETWWVGLVALALLGAAIPAGLRFLRKRLRLL